MYNTRYSYQILIKLEFSGHIFRKITLKKFTKIRQLGAEFSMLTDGQTD